MQSSEANAASLVETCAHSNTKDCAESCAETPAKQCAEILAPNVPAAAYAHACIEGAATLHGD